MEKLLQTLNEKPIFLRNAFLSQSNPLPNNSKLPENQTYITETKLSSFDIEDEDICKIIKALGINKAHGHYEVSIRMLKLCDESVVKPLSIILKNFKLKNTFPILWKKTNIVSIHKKGEKDLIKRYRPVLLLPIFGKIFKRLISNSLLSTLKRMNCVILVSQAFVHLILL